ncbi:hypothetical protein P175DRAFT_0473854 [Aspergillus ochraceoroseus IBT 24754]|uniref:Sterol desaturase family n=3 Tax=Aspergillus subgen. Nidulantes TaxID=2720870 RepID=A0A0F8WIT4_9EURO|nr:uncharacterized protein P175DRAFT_0473854 [Aspergillus ochraceoroseus IBT 24754]KKK15104.1 Sterol desaturase family [Aspergillus ochraceoroseus]KKK17635.1 Sterol desaturase family [Aspergillus rambellii]PTU22613.1 hypothetical protein P175DRAFT_0473854 [Aspergillus ochraceoroseus IBT 24754]
MDALFTLPVLSIFVLPTVSSYTTSLNLIFFYMTWSTLVLSHPPLRVELFGTAAVRLLFYLLPSLVFFLFDILLPSTAVVIKAHGETGLPTGSKRAGIRLREFKVAGWALANLALSLAVQAAIEEIRTRKLGMPSALRVSMRLPMPWDITKDLLRGVLVREILAYYIHRYILHSEHSRLAKYHQSWYHSLQAPFPLTAHYDHPLVYLLTNFFPTYAPAMLFRFHMLTYIVYLIIISIEETFAYSGYSVMPTSFFLGGIARRMDVHLLSGGEGNFGPWGILDWVSGTGVDDDEDDEEEDTDVTRVIESLTHRNGAHHGHGHGEEDSLEEKVRKAVEKSTKRRQEKHRLRKKRGVDY